MNILRVIRGIALAANVIALFYWVVLLIVYRRAQAPLWVPILFGLAPLLAIVALIWPQREQQ